MTALYKATIGDLGGLIVEQPHQALISVASVTLISTEAVTVLPLPAAIALAVGVEWAFLRGAASARRTDTPWAARLNWGAALVLLIYGGLASLRKFGAIPDEPALWLGALLTFFHVVPVFWVALCAAQTHAAMQRQEAQQAITFDTRRQEIDLQVYEAEQKALARARVRKVSHETPVRERPTASGQQMNSVRARLHETLQQRPEALDNKAALARELGISRAQLYRLLEANDGQ